jgi:hypothetical protein
MQRATYWIEHWEQRTALSTITGCGAALATARLACPRKWSVNVAQALRQTNSDRSVLRLSELDIDGVKAAPPSSRGDGYCSRAREAFAACLSPRAAWRSARPELYDSHQELSYAQTVASMAASRSVPLAADVLETDAHLRPDAIPKSLWSEIVHGDASRGQKRISRNGRRPCRQPSPPPAEDDPRRCRGPSRLQWRPAHLRRPGPGIFRERILGTSHPDTSATRERRAAVSRAAGRWHRPRGGSDARVMRVRGRSPVWARAQARLTTGHTHLTSHRRLDCTMPRPMGHQSRERRIASPAA